MVKVEAGFELLRMLHFDGVFVCVATTTIVVSSSVAYQGSSP